MNLSLLKHSAELAHGGADGITGTDYSCGGSREGRGSWNGSGSRDGSGGRDGRVVQAIQSLGGTIEMCDNVQTAVLETSGSLLLQQDPVGGRLLLLEETTQPDARMAAILNSELQTHQRFF